MGGDPAGNAHIPFGRVGGIHYARFFLLEPTADLTGNAIPGDLFFMADFDSPLPARLDNLLTAGAGWEEILGHCEGFAGTGVDACKKFFREHQVRDAAYYVNTVGLSVDQVRLESSLREVLEQRVDGSPDLHSLDPAAIRGKLVWRSRCGWWPYGCTSARMWNRRKNPSRPTYVTSKRSRTSAP